MRTSYGMPGFGEFKSNFKQSTLFWVPFLLICLILTGSVYISHNIVEIHWENNTVAGKLELNLSEGFRRMGIVSTMGDQAANLLLNGYKIGISSRAIGSVESKLGKMIVGEDLELLGWDIVSDPSTPQAFLGHYEGLQQFIESDNSKAKKPIMNEKINKMKELLS